MSVFSSEESHEYEVFPAVWIELGFAADAFAAKPTREVAPDRASINGPYLQLDAMQSERIECPSHDQASDLSAQPLAT